SWATNDARAGQYQRGYELRVAAKPADLDAADKVLWDSGTVTSGSPDASYAGPALRDGTRYWWAVRTEDAQGQQGPWSVPAQFGTALGAPWAGLRVGAKARAGGKSSGWAFLRGTVPIEHKPILAATVYVTGGTTEPTRQYVFRLSLNGKVLGVGPPRPL